MASRARNKVVLFFPIINPDTRYHWFPFSLLTLGATLKTAGFEPVIIDERLDPDYRDLLANDLDEAVCFGTTAMTGHQIKGGLESSRLVRELSPDVPIVWGGRHATLLPLQTVRHPLVDIVVRSQGEITLLEVAQARANGAKLGDVRGICHKKGDEVVSTPAREICDVRSLHGFGWDLIDIKRYINPETMAFAYFSSFGCPARCGFCTNSWFQRRWMSLDSNHVLNDLEYLITTYGFKSLMFQDSNFFVNRRRVETLANGFLARDFNLKWKASIRADQLWKYDDGILQLLEDSGLCSLFIGIESGSQRMLDQMQKDTTPEDALKSIRASTGFDFEIHVSLMFGIPNETIDDLRQSIEHVEQLRAINPDIKVQTCFYSPFPETPLNAIAESLGYVPPSTLEDWQFIKEQTEFNLPVWFDEEMAAEYERLFREAFRESAATQFDRVKNEGAEQS
jgi:radical SAM superfamily enzyme YgiQ (UPF0313 family)